MDAKIVLVGEAPGEVEEREGRPFVGGAGKVLNGILQDAGIDRSLCYVTNVMQERPPNNNFGHFYHGKEAKPELLAGITRVIHEIQSIRPTMVVCLGNEPLKALTGKDGITHWRGSILDGSALWARWIVPTYHPAAVMRQWDWRPVTVFDFQRVVELAGNAAWEPSRRLLVTDVTWERAQWILGQLEALADLEGGSPRRVAFDIEVETAQIQSIAFSWMPQMAACIPFWFGASGSYWTPDQEAEIWDRLSLLMANPRIEWIAQNAQYDTTFLFRQWGIRVRNLWMDTMIAHHTLYPELPKSLAFQTSIYTDLPFYKDLGKSQDSATFWRYNALDACVTYEIAVELEKELTEVGLWAFYREKVNPLIQPITEMSWRGVKVDLETRKTLTKEYEARIKGLEATLEQQVGHPLNPASAKQMQTWLYEELGIPKVTRYRKGGKNGAGETTTTDETALREILAKRPELAAIHTILEIRATRKVVSTYLKAEVDEDGRMRASFLIGGTETGRLASSENPYGTGTNLQNVPHGDVRKLFVPDEGKVFVSADLSQAEARVVAYLAKEERLIALFEAGGDVHRKTASAIFGKPEEAVVEEERQLAKRVVHASNYGMGPRKFAQVAGVGEKEARQLLDRYFANFPRIKMWHLQVEDQLRKTRVLRTPMGRVRQFLAAWNDDLIREAFAYVPQSTVSDLLNEGLLALTQSDLPAELLLQVHDSVVVQCLEADVERVEEGLCRLLTRPMEVNGRRVVIPVGVKVGRNWDEV